MTDSICTTTFTPNQFKTLFTTLFTDAANTISTESDSISCALEEFASKVPKDVKISDNVSKPSYITDTQADDISSIYDIVIETLGMENNPAFSKDMVDLTMRILNSYPSTDREGTDTSSRVEELTGGMPRTNPQFIKKEVPQSTQSIPTTEEYPPALVQPAAAPVQYEEVNTGSVILTVLTPIASTYALCKLQQTRLGSTYGTVAYVVVDTVSRFLFPQGRLKAIKDSTLRLSGEYAMKFLSAIGTSVGNIAQKGLSTAMKTLDEKFDGRVKPLLDGLGPFVAGVVSLVILLISVVYLINSIMKTWEDVGNGIINISYLPKFIGTLLGRTCRIIYERKFLMEITSTVSKSLAIFPTFQECGIGEIGLEDYAKEGGLLGVVGKAATFFNVADTLSRDSQTCYSYLIGLRASNISRVISMYKTPLNLMEWSVLNLTNYDIFEGPNKLLDKVPVIGQSLLHIDGVRKRVMKTPGELKQEHSIELAKKDNTISEQANTIAAMKSQLDDYKSLTTKNYNGGKKSRRRKAKKAKKKTRKNHKKKTRKSGKKKAKRSTTKRR